MLRLTLLRLVLLRLVLLRLILLRLVLLGLVLLRLARIERLRFTGRKRFAADVRLFVLVVIAVIAGIAAAIASLLLKIRLSLAELFLRGGDQAEIMFSVLIVVFGGDRIPRTLRIPGQLQIFLGDVGSRAPDFYVLAV
jgi:hypothetical protein